MADQFIETKHLSWGARIKESLAGALLGAAMFLISFPLLTQNEGRAVRTARSLSEGAAAVASVPADRVDPAMEGKLVHLSGTSAADAPLADPALGAAVAALRLRRSVEMYQWQESKKTESDKKLGGGEDRRTIYTYSKTWSAKRLDSAGFRQAAEHANPELPASLPSEVWTQPAARLGAFTVPPGMLARLDGFQPVALDPAAAPKAAAALGRPVAPLQGRFFAGADAANPQVGDLRVTLESIPHGPITFVAAQSGSSLSPYRTSGGGEIELLRAGTYTAAEMFARAQLENALLTWLLRVGLFVFMWAGLMMLARPLSVLFDFIPILGSIVELTTGAGTFFIAGICWLVTIALAWIAYRPVIGGGLLAVALAFLALSAKKKAQLRAARGADGPLPQPQ